MCINQSMASTYKKVEIKYFNLSSILKCTVTPYPVYIIMYLTLFYLSVKKSIGTHTRAKSSNRRYVLHTPRVYVHSASLANFPEQTSVGVFTARQCARAPTHPPRDLSHRPVAFELLSNGITHQHTANVSSESFDRACHVLVLLTARHNTSPPPHLRGLSL